jgi:uncharacterized protein involved in exopolysaccharide biosynthesis/Mrp family chromosome partitioning ATPase
MQSNERRSLTPVVAGNELDLRALGRALWRRKWQIVVPTIVMAIIAFVSVQFVTPRYRSEARILIEGRDNVFLRPEAEKTLDRGVIDPEAVTSQVQVVLSRDLARQVIKQLKLGDLPEFDSMLRGMSVTRTLLSLIGLTKDPLNTAPEERVLEAYYERLNVIALDKSRVLAVSFESNDPDLAARVANAVADRYLAWQQAARQEQARSAAQWLAGEIATMRKKVVESEGKVDEFRSKSNLFLGSNSTPLSSQQLSEVNTQLAAARGQKADAETKARLIRETLHSGKPLESSEVLNSELIRRLSEQLVTLQAQHAEQSATLLGAHPRIKELRAQIADLQIRIRSEAEKIARSLENDARTADARVETLNASLTQLKNQSASSNEQDVELRALEREAKSGRDLLESYLAKYREAIARDNIDAAPAEARVISRAFVSNTPAFPKKLPIVLVITLTTLILCAGFVLTSELLDGPYVAALAPVTVPVQVPATPPAQTPARSSLLGSLLSRLRRGESASAEPGEPDIESPAHFTAALPSTSIDELVRGLQGSGDAGRRIAIVGAARDVGTTFAAIALGRALAKEASAILVDLALGSPNISIISSDPSAPGIGDLVQGRASFGQIITRDRFSRLQLVAVGQAGPDAAAIFGSQRLTATLDALGRAYDHVVIDAGALPELAAERLAGLAPRVVLVAADLSNPDIATARDRLLAAGFADVAVLSGRPQGSGEGVMQPAAA